MISIIFETSRKIMIKRKRSLFIFSKYFFICFTVFHYICTVQYLISTIFLILAISKPSTLYLSFIFLLFKYLSQIICSFFILNIQHNQKFTLNLFFNFFIIYYVVIPNFIFNIILNNFVLFTDDDTFHE